MTDESSDRSLINLGDMSKQATILIEKISEAVSGFCAPWQIKRVAKAKAAAALIGARTEIKVTELHRRAMRRFVDEEAKKQENIESITAKAIPQLDEKANPSAMEVDWVSNFFDKCRIVSDGEMQSLWSKVLAGEANAPGTYSKRTVNFLNSLDKSDALLFRRLCSFAWMVGDVFPLVYSTDAPIFSKGGITFTALTHLDAIGLVKFESISGFMRRELPKRIVAFYYGEPVIVEFTEEKDNTLELGHVLLTQVGKQLAPICGSEPNPFFFEYIVDRWVKRGLSISSPYPRRSVAVGSVSGQFRVPVQFWTTEFATR